MKTYLPSDATLIRRAGILENLARKLRNEARQRVADEFDREQVLEILYKMQKVVNATINGE
jgi:hypothetical protein